ncbi:helix-turn-helix transcriptional regulator [Candidatus Woesearchaeota archaeon]|nr:helix-turn-helix transcriptional regulator [Candidatus Woesearchaeota archaeon]
MEVKHNKAVLVIEIIGKIGTLKILELLENAPRRYNQLKSSCSSDRTLSQRLKQLDECGLVEAISIKSEGRFFVHYKITERGKEILIKVKEMK